MTGTEDLARDLIARSRAEADAAFNTQHALVREQQQVITQMRAAAAARMATWQAEQPEREARKAREAAAAGRDTSARSGADPDPDGDTAPRREADAPTRSVAPSAAGPDEDEPPHRWLR